MNFIAVHCGAGNHSQSNHLSLNNLCKNACNSAALQQPPGSALDMVVNAVTVLEDSPLSNAGLGSNLTRDGTVQCDAGLMDGATGNFAGVGAVSKVQNPIKLCQCMIKDQKASSVFVHPSLLVGPGAEEYAFSKGFVPITSESLVTEKSRNDLDKAQKIAASSSMLDTNDFFDSPRLDTVGAVGVDSAGECAAACSSGGILMKMTGRVGHAPIFGCSCFAQSSSQYSCAVSVSGCGEYLMRTQFAQKCAQYLLQSNGFFRQMLRCLILDSLPLPNRLEDFFHHYFLESEYLTSFERVHVLAGAIVLLYSKEDRLLEFGWMHNTKTMAVGYCSFGEGQGQSLPNPKATVSQKVEDKELYVNCIGMKK